MKEIVNRLHENRQVERAKEILESNGYKVTKRSKLQESFPPILHKLSKYHQNVVRTALIKAGIDIENTPYELTQITSGRDPRLKGLNNVTIIEAASGKHTDVIVWFNDKLIVDAYNFDESANYSALSWKKILSYAENIWVMEFDAGASASMKDKQAARKEAQQGVEQRYTDKTKPRYRNIDKSGYIIDPRKYQNMFAELNIKNGEQILQDAKDIYLKLANKLGDVDDPRGGYSNLLRNFPETFRDLKKALADYNNEQSEGLDSRGFSFYKERVMDLIKEIRNLTKKAQQYLD